MWARSSGSTVRPAWFRCLPASPRWAAVAESLYGNFYEDQLRAADVGGSLDDVERLLDKLEPLA